MPDILQKKINGISTGETDWGKIFMGFAMAFVFVMQQYHAMKVADLQAEIVPRIEYEKKHEQVLDKDVILKALGELSKRLDDIENKK